MNKDIKDFIKLELNFCEKKHREVNSRTTLGYGKEYWQGRIDELTVLLNFINN